jgi:hypothetical protein
MGVRAAQLQLPPAFGTSATQGFEGQLAQHAAYVESVKKVEEDTATAANHLLDLLESRPTAFSLYKGPPPNLLFTDGAMLAKYRQYMDAILAASQREQEAQVRLNKSQADNSAALTELLMKR